MGDQPRCRASYRIRRYRAYCRDADQTTYHGDIEQINRDAEQTTDNEDTAYIVDTVNTADIEDTADIVDTADMEDTADTV